jgi:hypothetical protein
MKENKITNALTGLATGIGSLPYKDTAPALDLIFKYAGKIPFWPQLPKRNIREGMVAQFSERIPGVKVTDDGIFFNHREKEKELEKFYDRLIANDEDYFKISQVYAQGLYAFYQRLEHSDLEIIQFVKCHSIGPFSFAGAINDENGVSLLHDEILMQAAIKGLAVKAIWQLNLFRKFGKKIIFFLDEPYLGCFGSAYTPINREDVIKGLSELTAAVHSADVLVGVHCCGNTDWSIFTDIDTVDIISFDAVAFLDRLVLYADNLKGFFERGGMLCWGIVPTQDFTGREAPEALVKNIFDGIEVLAKKGLDRNLVAKNLILSPSCGLGTLDAARAEGIFALLHKVSSIIKGPG